MVTVFTFFSDVRAGNVFTTTSMFYLKSMDVFERLTKKKIK